MTTPGTEKKKSARPLKLTIADVTQIVSALRIAAEVDATDAKNAAAGIEGSSPANRRMSALLDDSARRTRELADAINTSTGGLRFVPPAGA